MDPFLYFVFCIAVTGVAFDSIVWKTIGLIIGSPAFQLFTSSTDNPSPKIGGAWVLENQMELRPDQVQVLIEFLTAQENLLKRISSYDKEDAEQAISKVYKLIAAYGRMGREEEKSDKLIYMKLWIFEWTAILKLDQI